MVRIFGVQGSHRKGRNSDALLRHALAAAEEAGAETELVNLAELDIRPCVGCNTCVRERRCPLDEEDDMGAVKEALLRADGVVFASPSYFGAVPGLLKNMMDRSRSLKMDDHKLRDKAVSAVVVAGLRHGGAERVAESITHFGLTHGMVAVGGLRRPSKRRPLRHGEPPGRRRVEAGRRRRDRARLRRRGGAARRPGGSRPETVK